MTPEERAVYVKGLRDGIELAQRYAEISTWDGWQSHAPVIDWERVEKKLAEAEALAALEA